MNSRQTLERQELAIAMATGAALGRITPARLMSPTELEAAVRGRPDLAGRLSGWCLCTEVPDEMWQRARDACVDGVPNQIFVAETLSGRRYFVVVIHAAGWQHRVCIPLLGELTSQWLDSLTSKRVMTMSMANAESDRAFVSDSLVPAEALAHLSKKGASATANLDTPVPIGAKTFPGTDEPIPNGIAVRSGRGVQIRFQLNGERCFETIAGRPTIRLVRQAIETRDRVLTLISLGKFKYEEEFPESRHVREMVRRARLKTKMPVVGAALDAWFALVADSVGPNTHDDYRRIINYTLKPMPVSRLGIVKPHPCAGFDLQMLPVDELTAARLAALRNQLFAVDGLSVKRVSNILIPLRGMMPMLVVDKHLGADPFALLKPLRDTRVQADKPVVAATAPARPATVEDVAKFKTGKGKADPFSPTEVRAMLELAYGQVLNMVTFWVDEGLRTGEILGLQWQDFDLAAGTVTVRRSVSKGKLKTLKKYEQRTIKLYPGARAAAEAQVGFSGAQRAWVFPNPATGRRYANESKFTKRWKRLLAAAGVRYRRPYQLRHSSGSTLLSAGVSTIEAAYHLGHKDITMLARHYGHLIAEVANLPGATFEEKFGPIWAHRVELVRTRQQPPEGDDWLAGADGDGGEAEADEGDDGED